MSTYTFTPAPHARGYDRTLKRVGVKPGAVEAFTVTTDADGMVKDVEAPPHVMVVVDSMLGSDMYTNHIATFKRAFDPQYTCERTGDDEGEEEYTEKADIDGELESIVKTDDEKRLLFGWAYVTHDNNGQQIVDKSGEFLRDVDTLEDMAYNFVITKRVQGHQHGVGADGSARQVGTMVESMVFTPEKMQKMGIPAGSLPTGWWVGFKVDDDQAWQDAKSGKSAGFSIKGRAVRKEV